MTCYDPATCVSYTTFLSCASECRFLGLRIFFSPVILDLGCLGTQSSRRSQPPGVRSLNTSSSVPRAIACHLLRGSRFSFFFRVSVRKAAFTPLSRALADFDWMVTPLATRVNLDPLPVKLWYRLDGCLECTFAFLDRP